ncbi:MAG: archaeosortase/exosortase family protein [Opitutales bacterium]
MPAKDNPPALLDVRWPERLKDTDVRLALVAYAGVVILFAPLLVWALQQTVAREQLHLAFVILAGAGIWLIVDNREKLRLRLELDDPSRWLLIGAYTSFVLGWVMQAFAPPGWNLVQLALLLAGPCLALGSLIRFLLGAKAARASQGLLIAFFAYLALALVLPVYDWPLRRIAGEWSLWLLQTLGVTSRLGTVPGGQPMLLLEVEGRLFNVAQECNGFGLLSASILLTLLLLIYRRVDWTDRALLMAAAITGALAANALRILVIVLVAPLLPHSQYQLMHDTVGIVIFYAALGLLWWFIRGFGRSPDAPPNAPAPA